MTEEKVGRGRGGKGPPDPLEALEAFKGNLSYLFFCDFSSGDVSWTCHSR